MELVVGTGEGAVALFGAEASLHDGVVEALGEFGVEANRVVAEVVEAKHRPAPIVDDRAKRRLTLDRSSRGTSLWSTGATDDPDEDPEAASTSDSDAPPDADSDAAPEEDDASE